MGEVESIVNYAYLHKRLQVGEIESPLYLTISHTTSQAKHMRPLHRRWRTVVWTLSVLKIGALRLCGVNACIYEQPDPGMEWLCEKRAKRTGACMKFTSSAS